MTDHLTTKARLEAELERMAVERDTDRELCRDALADRDAWKKGVVDANRISQQLEARAVQAEAELARVTRERDAALEVLRELAVRVQNYGPSPVMPEGQALYEALTAAACALSVPQGEDTK